MKAGIPSSERRHRQAAAELRVLAQADEPRQSEAAAEFLTPYQSVAKAIFVRANGLPAYRRAARTFQYSD